MKKIVKKLHLYLGIACALIYLNLSATGILISLFNYYSFVVDRIFVGGYDEQNRSIDELMATFRTFKPKFKLKYISFQDDFIGFEGRDVEGYKTYFYYRTGEFLGESLPSDNFLSALYELHFNLGFKFLGLEKVGRCVIAIVNLGLVFFIFSGLWLYIKDLKRNVGRALQLNFHYRGLARYRNYHAAFGLWATPLLIVICLSGAFYSFYTTLGGFVEKLDVGRRERVERGMDFSADVLLYGLKLEGNSWLYFYSDTDYGLALGNFAEYTISTRDGLDRKIIKKSIGDLIYNLHTGFFNRFTQIVWVICCIVLLVVVWLGIKMGFGKSKKLYGKFSNLNMINLFKKSTKCN